MSSLGVIIFHQTIIFANKNFFEPVSATNSDKANVEKLFYTVASKTSLEMLYCTINSKSYERLLSKSTDFIRLSVQLSGGIYPVTRYDSSVQ